MSPFGGGAFSDLSVYQIGAAPAAPTPLTPTPFPQPTYTAADPPPRPTVAPAVGVLPQPVLPGGPTRPFVYLNPDTSLNPPVASKTPTTARLLAELLAPVPKVTAPAIAAAQKVVATPVVQPKLVAAPKPVAPVVAPKPVSTVGMGPRAL